MLGALLLGTDAAENSPVLLVSTAQPSAVCHQDLTNHQRRSHTLWTTGCGPAPIPPESPWPLLHDVPPSRDSPAGLRRVTGQPRLHSLWLETAGLWPGLCSPQEACACLNALNSPCPAGRAPGDVAGANAAGHSLGLCCSNWATRTQKRRRKRWSPGAHLLPGGKMRIYDPWKHKTVQWKAETEGGVQ